ncbi:hypothetical protein CLHUN_00130 [Ruminiclostridium hungatei]|uniref:Uncharacterized protein n=1 Tax=Ruminiclostridium hungatei TaxID=48256 RepID=A0A1V4SSI1_RUMHU|nr:hypothetical protein [Ruminiclostridium hungatei]OPX46197.1 hypothetical protein CLHUN_00130 [Ruminiclostridium hungatei]
MFEKMIICQQNRLLDVAGGGLLLALAAGIPLLLVILVIAAVIIAVVLINKSAGKDNKNAKVHLTQKDHEDNKDSQIKKKTEAEQ